jgi:hypothetical protein
MDTIRAELLQGHDYTTPVVAELYKLNVYGKFRLLLSRLYLMP